MIVIGIVGLLSSGKSTVCETLSKNGSKVINLDILSHDIYKPGSSAYQEIINIWGSDVLDEQRKISRSYLAEKVFGKGDNEISKLEKIVWPRLISKLEEKLIKYHQEKLIFVEGAKILNSDFVKYCDKVWCVVSSIENIKNRIFSSSQDHKNLLERLKSQINEYTYLTGIDEFIENNSTRQDLNNNVKLLLEKTRKEYFNDSK
tara:strand:- start:427 stop:1035 length:609 start_codon:yes stop_codon:yes gene_type:complete